MIVLIDGNNLAHYLYPDLLAGQRMDSAHSQLLINHLASYLRSHTDPVQLEVCMDRTPVAARLSLGTREDLRVFYPEYPQTADDFLLERFCFHRISGQPCLVVTNDEDILEAVAEARGTAIRVFDFVRRPGLTNPVFLAPGELPNVTAAPQGQPLEQHSLAASIYFRIVQDTRRAAPRPRIVEPAAAAPRLEKTPVVVPAQPPCCETKDCDPPASAAPEAPAAEPLAAAEPPEPYYLLTLDNWPPESGLRFLAGAFCPAHRAAYGDLIASVDFEAPTAAEVRAMADLWLFTCGSEPELARQGALMARVRLALLQARGEPLSLTQLAERTGLKSTGLQGRIRQKAGPWIAIR